MMYLFHNIYGDAKELIENAPLNVTCVPFGWSLDTEENRNRILRSIGAQVSCLPSLIFFVEGYKDIVTLAERSDSTRLRFVEQDIPARWHELRIKDMPKPWTWQTILQEKDVLLGEAAKVIRGG